ncbi:hypothetical protein ADH75_14005 [Flavonifractor plautii]|uniref:Transposase IS200-like domain-containing protein n=2 Tax=Flavonifractor plautii TaxID=292800 RepID=A0AAX1KL46_FLAPL|nr:hypothetical protein A4U99_05425 [Flavonifractor plautii]OXE44679.1 hypothetical protein ADH75_14005 [Flavonifractor plautii]QQR06691.1 hypothetical protein I5Q84_04105 [Flavonifractor plautii]
MPGTERRSLRLKGYDYSARGAYFLTICVKDRKCTLGRVVGPMGTSAPTGGIPALVRYFKRQMTGRLGEAIWQRSYYGHVIRSEADYLRIWEYMDTNPARWGEDAYYIAQES